MHYVYSNSFFLLTFRSFKTFRCLVQALFCNSLSVGYSFVTLYTIGPLENVYKETTFHRNKRVQETILGLYLKKTKQVRQVRVVKVAL